MLLPLLVCLAAVSGSGFGATVVSAKHPELRSAQQKADSLVVEPVVLDGAAMVGKQRQQQQLDDEEAVMVGRLVKALGPRRRAAAGPAEAGGEPARPQEELARIFALARGLIEQEGTASFGRDTSRRLATLVRGEGSRSRSSSRHSALSASSAAGSPA